jgi:hypothetical protein
MPQTAPERRPQTGVAVKTQGGGTMASVRHKRRPDAADVTGWLLGATIVVLAVLDLMIWATVWNVPMSKFLEPRAVSAAVSPAPAPFR